MKELRVNLNSLVELRKNGSLKLINVVGVYRKSARKSRAVSQWVKHFWEEYKDFKDNATERHPLLGLAP